MGFGTVVVVTVALLLVGCVDYVRQRKRAAAERPRKTAHLPHPGHGSIPHVGLRRAGVRSLRETSSYVRVGLLLVAAWAVWLLAFVVWAWTIPEWDSDNFYIGYTVLSVVAVIVVAIGVVAAIRRPGWGEIRGGLVVTLLGQWGSRDAVTELRNWGSIVVHLNEDRGSPWVPLDTLDLVPYSVLRPPASCCWWAASFTSVTRQPARHPMRARPPEELLGAGNTAGGAGASSRN